MARGLRADAASGRLQRVNATAEYLKRAINELCGVASGRVLDWGCGRGQLVEDLNAVGLETLGCDQNPNWVTDQGGRLRAIETSPYRLPFDSDLFDVVVSTSVLEHAQNKKECFREIHRVLKPGGHALHIFPAKHYLPSEPHIYVPLANFFWPYVPQGWLAFWAWAGVRNEFQVGKPWREVATLNASFCRTGLSYWTSADYEKLSSSVFGNYSWPMEHFLEFGDGGLAAIARKLPFRTLWGYVSRKTRMAFLMNQKFI